MLNKYRALGSLGVGILIFVIGMMVILFIWKLLNSPQWMTTGIIWLLCWPMWIAMWFFRIDLTSNSSVAIALSSGVIADIAILSLLIYLALAKFSRLSPRPSSPPPPTPFD